MCNVDEILDIELRKRPSAPKNEIKMLPKKNHCMAVIVKTMISCFIQERIIYDQARSLRAVRPCQRPLAIARFRVRCSELSVVPVEDTTYFNDNVVKEQAGEES